MTKHRKEKEEVLEDLKRADPKLRVTWNKKTNIPRRMKGKLTGTMEGEPEEVARAFLSERKELFGISDAEREFVLKRVDGDRLGMNHVRLIQHYRGIPVYGGELVIHIDKKNVVTGVHGEYQPDIDVNIEPSISKETAIENARRHAKSETRKVLVEPELRIFARKDSPILAWQFIIEGTDVDFRGVENPAEWLYLIDAHTGDFVHRANQMIAACTASNGSGTGYYSGQHEETLNTCHDSENNKYLLQDKTREGVEIVTHDLDGSTDETLVSISEDSDNNWDDDVIPPRKDHQGPEVDAHHYTGIVHDYFKRVHLYTFTNMVLKVHYRYWRYPNDDLDNAYYSQTEDAVLVGDAKGDPFDYLTELDILAHEWTHALHHAHTDFEYEEEPGAVAESMADFFACMIDENWLIGEESFLPTTAPAARNLEDPTNDGKFDSTDYIASVKDGHQPDHMDDKFTCTHVTHSGSCDYGGVHINSGILNKAAYLLVEGGTHGGIEVCGTRSRRQIANIYYRALTKYLSKFSDFEDLREALLDSADDLEYFSQRTEARIRGAFAAVGIGQAGYQYACPRPRDFLAWIIALLLVFPVWWPIVLPWPPGPDPIAILITVFLGLLIASALAYRMWFQTR